ncbi:hypothetical protein ABH926_004713 [Catenulispora sp. GP43]|uniref:hypothetical protein n=1 Tax=Catenulispora sp. GP43 TaxID=3156263 RepID=UPI00351690E0
MVLASGAGFADALAGVPAATGDWLSSGGKPAAIVLSNGSRITDPATAAFVKARMTRSPGPQPGSIVDHVLVLGGKAFCAVDTMYADATPPQCQPFPDMIGTGIGEADLPGLPSKHFSTVIGKDRYQTATELADFILPVHSLPGPDCDNWQDNRGLFGIASALENSLDAKIAP